MYCKCTVSVLYINLREGTPRQEVFETQHLPGSKIVTRIDRSQDTATLDLDVQWCTVPSKKDSCFLLFFTIFLLGCYFTIFYLRFALPGSPPLLALQIVSAAGGDVPRVTVCKHGRHGRHGRHRPLIIHRLHRIDIGDFDRQRATRTNFKTQLLNQSHFKIRIAQTYQTK